MRIEDIPGGEQVLRQFPAGLRFDKAKCLEISLIRWGESRVLWSLASGSRAVLLSVYCQELEEDFLCDYGIFESTIEAIEIDGTEGAYTLRVRSSGRPVLEIMCKRLGLSGSRLPGFYL